MSQLQKNISLLGLLFVISACGLKDDLYLPESQPQIVGSPAQEIKNTVNNSPEIETTSEAVPEDITPDSIQPE